MKRILIVVGVLALLACICGAVVIYFFMQDVAETKEKYGEEIVAMCDSISPDAPDPANFPTGSSPYQVVIFDEGQPTLHGYNDEFSDDLRAADKDEANLVICIRDGEEVVEECEYTETGDDGETIFTLQRIQKNHTLFVFNAQTGGKIAELTVTGSEPEACPDEKRGSEGDTQKIEGEDVTFAAFRTAIEPYINGTVQ